jgi:hypothetical protein
MCNGHVEIPAGVVTSYTNIAVEGTDYYLMPLSLVLQKRKIYIYHSLCVLKPKQIFNERIIESSVLLIDDEL